MNLKESYILLMALICCLYEEKNCSRFFEAWMPLDYTMDLSRSIFNWGDIISKQLSTGIEEAKNPKAGEIPTFYMAYYLLDAICATNVFLGLSISFHVFELLVHVYFNILWENKYKWSITIINDGFISQVYSHIFKRYFPRLSETTRKVISNIGHWYLKEIRTYIRIFKPSVHHTYY